ncbi:hypothetical protein [Aestuariibaculum suncheonense]|uniref:Uncharacterized protein n=1 Tax=Aestuariibaculum suncheonense TaxID=1028745 RepID=A0A8J6Q3N9_9FLAO|nr:hypothetical protein [Aestuariibaculum suncheonense]MBD0834037.1 hypothetical protein [Aestuariibaculum suncheonense]
MFSTFSSIRYLKTIIIQSLLIILLLVTITSLKNNFNWNLLAVSIFILFIFLITYYEEIVINEHTLQLNRKYVFGLISFKTKFKLSEIKEIEVEGKFTKKSDLTEDLLDLFLPVHDFQNSLYIKTIQNTEHKFNLHIYKEYLDQVIKLVKQKA